MAVLSHFQVVAPEDVGLSTTLVEMPTPWLVDQLYLSKSV